MARKELDEWHRKIAVLMWSLIKPKGVKHVAAKGKVGMFGVYEILASGSVSYERLLRMEKVLPEITEWFAPGEKKGMSTAVITEVGEAAYKKLEEAGQALLFKEDPTYQKRKAEVAAIVPVPKAPKRERERKRNRKSKRNTIAIPPIPDVNIVREPTAMKTPRQTKFAAAGSCM